MQPIQRCIYEYRCKHPTGARPMSLNEFADACGINRMTLTRLLRGDTPSISTLIKIADCIGCTLDELAGRR